MYLIQTRKKILVNTDQKRRCYNGCHFKSELVWSEWETLESNVPKDRLKYRLEFWRGLNKYAVSQRGKSARSEYRKSTTGDTAH